jgi:hypothetical protein
MDNYVSINPSDTPETAQEGRGFAALIHVTSSRYVKREYQDESLAPKVAVKWIMGTTKGNSFERMWTTGIPWEDGRHVSPDGKHLTDKPMSKNCDAQYLLRKAIASDFPNDKIKNDISVFEGETFFMTEDTNPKSKGSYKGLYPKQYHPEGWDTALAETLARRAAREAQQNAPAYGTEATLQSSYTPPQVVQSDDVMRTAGEALVSILEANGSTVTRNQIPGKFSTYVSSKEKETNRKWEDKFRQTVLTTLWELPTLQAIVNNNPKLKLDGDSVSISN